MVGTAVQRSLNGRYSTNGAFIDQRRILETENSDTARGLMNITYGTNDTLRTDLNTDMTKRTFIGTLNNETHLITHVL